jgi:predicted amidophosphoribosyltransferase
MFDSENCIRCRKKYRFEELMTGPDGFGICKACAAKIDSVNEQKRRCPVDGQEMVKRLVGNAVLLDKCVACGGVWFDGDELRIVNDLIKEESFTKVFWIGFCLG